MSIKIYLDRKRHLVFDARAISEMASVMNTKRISNGDFTLGDMVHVLYCGLIHEDPDLTKEVLLRIIYESQTPIPTIMNKFGEAWKKAYIPKGMAGKSAMEDYIEINIKNGGEKNGFKNDQHNT